MSYIPIYKPYLINYSTSAKKAIESEWISNHGEFVTLASKELCSIMGVKYCILMNNGTSAVHCLFLALKKFYPYISKIYIPNYVFVAPINCGLMVYPKKIFEIMPTNFETMNMETSEEYIMSLDTNAAICIVHNLGNIVNVPRIKKLRPDLIILEDNCEGIFGRYDGLYSGSLDLSGVIGSAVSFYGNKTITTGEGGAFLTNNKDIFDYITTVYSHGMSSERYIHNDLGYNYRMTNVQAGFLYDQLLDINTILSMKKNIFERYAAAFEKLFQQHILAPIKPETDKVKQSNWIYAVRTLIKFDFEKFEKFMNEHKIQVRPIFYHLDKHKHLQGLTRANKVDNEQIPYGFMLPSFPELAIADQNRIIETIYQYF